MAVDLKLSMRLGQQMVMTPQLQAAIKLLQMNRMELADTIQSELMENPLLEEGSEVSELDQKKAELEAADNSEQVHELAPETDKNPDFDWETYLEQSFAYSGKSTAALTYDPAMDEGPSFESVSAKKKTLSDHLLEQMNVSDFDTHEREFALVLISSLDEWGYLREPLEELAKKRGVNFEFAEFILKMVQEFDPAGIAARDLKECLLLQLQRSKNLHQLDKEMLQQLIETQLHNLEKRNFKAIAKEMNVELEELASLVKILQKFEPRPGRPFAESDNPYITPDIYIQKVNGEYVITLNEDGLPKLKISNLYRSIMQTMPEMKDVADSVKKSGTVEEELSALATENAAPADEAMNPRQNPREYIQNKLRAALWLIRSIHQRQRTIYKVTESIVKSQREFLEYGVTHLRPMVLKDVAQDIGMHESTISRVTSNKFVHTPQGIFELKYFFSSAIQKSNGDGIAAESVKEKIRAIIKSEDSGNPISDQGIVDALTKQGINIARRTVAKYREMLGILPSSQRKNLF